MPELPEVETVKKGLLDFIPLKINKVERTPELKSILKTEEFSLKGLTISSLERKGKFRSDVKRITQTIAEEMEFLIRKAPEQWHLMQPNWPSDSKSEKGRV